MIPSIAIKQFLRRERDDCRYYKSLTSEQLEEMIRELPIRPPVWSKLRLHQKQGLLMGIDLRTGGFHMDTGMGKSLLSMALTLYFKRLGLLKQVLILVPNRTNRDEWGLEIEKHVPNETYLIPKGTSAQKLEQILASDATFILETYMGLVRMVSTLVAKKKRGKLTGKEHLKLSPTKIKHLVRKLGGAFADESSLLGNKFSLFTRVARQLAKHGKIFFELTGTPFGRDPTMLWSQMFLLDGGWSLGETLGLFRAAFFTAKENYWGGTDYKFDPTKEKQLHRFLAHRTVRYEADKSDLPRMVPIVKQFRLPQDAQAYFDRAKETMLAAHGRFKEQKNAFLRMRQISSGFLGYKDDELGVRASLEFSPNPKLDLCTSLLSEITPNHKVVVFCDFVYSSDLLVRELKRLHIGHVRLYGKTKDTSAVRRAFDRDDKVRVFVVTSAAGWAGLNLQIAKYLIYFESPVSPIVRKQTQRRVERQESEHDTVFVYDLVGLGTYDQRILDFHAEGRDLFAAIVDGEAVERRGRRQGRARGGKGQG